MNWMSLTLYSFFAGVFPMLAWSMLVWWFDRFEKEPLPLLGFAFLWGVAPAAIFSLTMENLFGLPLARWVGVQSIGLNLVGSGIIGPGIEESFKFLGIVGILWVARAEIDGVLDGIIYAALVGFGFASAENVLFFLSSPAEALFLPAVVLRACLFGLNHAMFSAFAGYGLAKAKFSASRSRAMFWAAGGLLVSAVVHAIYNTGVVLAVSLPWAFGLSFAISLTGVSVIFWLYSLALQREGSIIRTQLIPLRDSGVISQEEWLCTTSIRRRLSAEWRALRQMNFSGYRRISRFHHLCAKWALTARQLRRLGPSTELEERMAAILRELQPTVQNSI